jgi:type IV secretory pathway TraG/TraD family ATPase VirD4
VADVNGRNAVATLHENCQHKLLYGTIDADTTTWSSEQTGTIEIVTEMRESTAQKGRGARWEGEVT